MILEPIIPLEPINMIFIAISPRLSPIALPGSFARASDVDAVASDAADYTEAASGSSQAFSVLDFAEPDLVTQVKSDPAPRSIPSPT
jgi:hypothetical protein